MTDRSAVSEAGNDGADPDGRLSLEIGREEARTALDHQIRTLDDIDTKASKILRLNVALLSILLMGASVLAKSPNYGAIELLTPLSLLGVGSLVVSTAFAGLTYTSSEFQAGLGPEDLRTVLEGEYDDAQLQEALVASYAEWIAFNDATNVRNESLITLTIVSTVYAVAFLTLGVIDVFLDSIPGLVVLFAVLTLFAFTLFTGVPTKLARWYRAVEPAATLRRKALEVAERFSVRENNERP
jgi:hypothetical protein